MASPYGRYLSPVEKPDFIQKCESSRRPAIAEERLAEIEKVAQEYNS